MVIPEGFLMKSQLYMANRQMLAALSNQRVQPKHFPIQVFVCLIHWHCSAALNQRASVTIDHGLFISHDSSSANGSKGGALACREMIARERERVASVYAD